MSRYYDENSEYSSEISDAKNPLTPIQMSYIDLKHGGYGKFESGHYKLPLGIYGQFYDDKCQDDVKCALTKNVYSIKVPDDVIVIGIRYTEDFDKANTDNDKNSDNFIVVGKAVDKLLSKKKWLTGSEKSIEGINYRKIKPLSFANSKSSPYYGSFIYAVEKINVYDLRHHSKNGYGLGSNSFGILFVIKPNFYSSTLEGLLTFNNTDSEYADKSYNMWCSMMLNDEGYDPKTSKGIYENPCGYQKQQLSNPQFYTNSVVLGCNDLPNNVVEENGVLKHLGPAVDFATLEKTCSCIWGAADTGYKLCTDCKDGRDDPRKCPAEQCTEWSNHKGSNFGYLNYYDRSDVTGETCITTGIKTAKVMSVFSEECNAAILDGMEYKTAAAIPACAQLPGVDFDKIFNSKQSNPDDRVDEDENKCVRGGAVLDANRKCICPGKGEEWDGDRCVCKSGYSKNEKTGKCEEIKESNFPIALIIMIIIAIIGFIVTVAAAYGYKKYKERQDGVVM